MTLPITTLHAGLLGLLMALLSIRVPLRRDALEVPFGDGGDEALATRIRAFGNFIEYVPMLLLLLALLESGGLGANRLHALGATLLAARVLHALAYRGRLKLSLPEKVGRGVAAMSTWAALVFAAGAAVWMARGALLP